MMKSSFGRTSSNNNQQQQVHSSGGYHVAKPRGRDPSVITGTPDELNRYHYHHHNNRQDYYSDNPLPTVKSRRGRDPSITQDHTTTTTTSIHTNTNYHYYSDNDRIHTSTDKHHNKSPATGGLSFGRTTVHKNDRASNFGRHHRGRDPSVIGNYSSSSVQDGTVVIGRPPLPVTGNDDLDGTVVIGPPSSMNEDLDGTVVIGPPQDQDGATILMAADEVDLDGTVYIGAIAEINNESQDGATILVAPDEGNTDSVDLPDVNLQMVDESMKAVSIDNNEDDQYDYRYDEKLHKDDLDTTIVVAPDDTQVYYPTTPALEGLPNNTIATTVGVPLVTGTYVEQDDSCKPAAVHRMDEAVDEFPENSAGLLDEDPMVYSFRNDNRLSTINSVSSVSSSSALQTSEAVLKSDVDGGSKDTTEVQYKENYGKFLSKSETEVDPSSAIKDVHHRKISQSRDPSMIISAPESEEFVPQSRRGARDPSIIGSNFNGVSSLGRNKHDIDAPLSSVKKKGRDPSIQSAPEQSIDIPLPPRQTLSTRDPSSSDKAILIPVPDEHDITETDVTETEVTENDVTETEFETGEMENMFTIQEGDQTILIMSNNDTFDPNSRDPTMIVFNPEAENGQEPTMIWIGPEDDDQDKRDPTMIRMTPEEFELQISAMNALTAGNTDSGSDGYDEYTGNQNQSDDEQDDRKPEANVDTHTSTGKEKRSFLHRRTQTDIPESNKRQIYNALFSRPFRNLESKEKSKKDKNNKTMKGKTHKSSLSDGNSAATGSRKKPSRVRTTSKGSKTSQDSPRLKHSPKIDKKETKLNEDSSPVVTKNKKASIKTIIRKQRLPNGNIREVIEKRLIRSDGTYKVVSKTTKEKTRSSQALPVEINSHHVEHSSGAPMQQSYPSTVPSNHHQDLQYTQNQVFQNQVSPSHGAQLRTPYPSAQSNHHQEYHYSQNHVYQNQATPAYPPPTYPNGGHQAAANINNWGSNQQRQGISWGKVAMVGLKIAGAALGAGG